MYKLCYPRIKKVALILTLMPSLVACDLSMITADGRYEGKMDERGNYFVLDTRTGSLAKADGGVLVDIPNSSKLREPQSLSSRSIPNIPIEISLLQVKYRQGNLLYQGRLVRKSRNLLDEESADVTTKKFFENFESLWEGGTSYAPRRIIIKLIDADGFNVKEIIIGRASLTKVVNEEGDPVMFSFSGEKSLSPVDYESIEDYHLNWNLAEWNPGHSN